MTLPRLTRRGLAPALTALLFAPRALATPAPAFPMRIGYTRIGAQGFLRIRSAEQQAWDSLRTRTGGLIDLIDPIQPGDMLGANAPVLDGGASCALVARQMAAGAGYTHVILYATQDGRRVPEDRDNWVSKAFENFRSEYMKYDRATGEAHLLDVSGGAAIVSVSADVAPRNPLDPFDNHRKPEAETLTALIVDLEHRLQSLARAGYEAQRSIAD
jgi:hypothetical protein